METEARLADQEVQLGLTRNSEPRLRAAFDTRQLEIGTHRSRRPVAR